MTCCRQYTYRRGLNKILQTHDVHAFDIGWHCRYCHQGTFPKLVVPKEEGRWAGSTSLIDRLLTATWQSRSYISAVIHHASDVYDRRVRQQGIHSESTHPYSSRDHGKLISPSYSENHRLGQNHQVRPPWYQFLLPCYARSPFLTHSSLHIARFSPDDKFSRHRVTIKKRYGVLLTQLPCKPM